MSPLTKQFHDAVLTLAGHAPIKQRLVSAYSEHLSGIHDEDLPRRLLGRFADLRRRLHGVTPLNGEGPVRASVRKMSGAEAAAQIRTEERKAARPPVPIYSISANAMPHQVRDYSGAGMDGHLAKPFRKVEIADIVRRHAPPRATIAAE